MPSEWRRPRRRDSPPRGFGTRGAAGSRPRGRDRRARTRGIRCRTRTPGGTGIRNSRTVSRKGPPGEGRRRRPGTGTRGRERKRNEGPNRADASSALLTGTAHPSTGRADSSERARRCKPRRGGRRRVYNRWDPFRRGAIHASEPDPAIQRGGTAIPPCDLTRREAGNPPGDVGPPSEAQGDREDPGGPETPRREARRGRGAREAGWTPEVRPRARAARGGRAVGPDRTPELREVGPRAGADPCPS